MNAKDYLLDYARHIGNIEMYKSTKEQAERDLESLPQLPERYNPCKDKYKATRQIIEAVKVCDEYIEQHRRECQRIEAAINSLEDPRQRQVLQMRYIQQPPATWEAIGETMGYCLQSCHRIHNAALKNISI